MVIATIRRLAIGFLELLQDLFDEQVAQMLWNPGILKRESLKIKQF